jgi:hypothetical protein
MRTAVALLELFVVAIVLAFAVTVATGTSEMRALAVGLVVPIAALGVAFVRYCRLGRLWSYAGASVLGVLGVTLRVVVSTQPSLEVGGGLPVGVTVIYIVLGSLLALKGYESVLELRQPRRGSPDAPSR